MLDSDIAIPAYIAGNVPVAASGIQIKL